MDNLLRDGALVDLYKVVREGIRISEPSYSIKYVEHFYRPPREGDVQNAGASIVFYEKWRETQDRTCWPTSRRTTMTTFESTRQLREWLLTLRPASVRLGSGPAEQDAAGTAGQMTDVEARLVPYRQAMVGSLPQDRLAWTPDEQARS